MKAHFILYVRDQLRASEFYRYVLGIEPTVDEPGMTEFALAGQRRSATQAEPPHGVGHLTLPRPARSRVRLRR
jgi:catechol 2,3-dioxygenase-like lactoylglutathione lyase family enzyme